MLDEIEKITMPDWLQGDTFRFNLQNIVRDSLYYPACGFDGVPVTYFMGNIYSFIYADSGKSEEDFNGTVDKWNAFKGYKIIHKKCLSKSRFVKEVNDYFKILVCTEPRLKDRAYMDHAEKPYCYWIIFERLEGYTDEHNPKRFSLLYLCSEGVSAYHVLYVNKEIAPQILCIIRSGPFSGNWTRFTDSKQDLGKVVFSMNNRPKYLFGEDNSLEWPEYDKKILQKKNIDSTDGNKLFALWGQGMAAKRRPAGELVHPGDQARLLIRHWLGEASAGDEETFARQIRQALWIEERHYAGLRRMTYKRIAAKWRLDRDQAEALIKYWLVEAPADDEETFARQFGQALWLDGRRYAGLRRCFVVEWRAARRRPDRGDRAEALIKHWLVEAPADDEETFAKQLGQAMWLEERHYVGLKRMVSSETGIARPTHGDQVRARALIKHWLAVEAPADDKKTFAEQLGQALWLEARHCPSLIEVTVKGNEAKRRLTRRQAEALIKHWLAEAPADGETAFVKQLGQAMLLKERHCPNRSQAGALIKHWLVEAPAEDEETFAKQRRQALWLEDRHYAGLARPGQ